MSDLLAVTWADSKHLRGFYTILCEQFKRQGIELLYEPLEPFSWNRMVRAELDFCRKHPGKRIVGVDAEDFLFLGTAEELDSVVPEDTILYHAEAACWPEPHLADLYPPCPTPNRYVNGTTPCGSTDALAAAIEWGLKHCPIRGDSGSIFADNDQRFFTHTYLNSYGIVDYDCCLSVQLNAVEPEDFSVVGKRIVLKSGITPIFAHANGASKFRYADVLERLV